MISINLCEVRKTDVSILILMDLPFLSAKKQIEFNIEYTGFNPYSNGSSFFI